MKLSRRQLIESLLPAAALTLAACGRRSRATLALHEHPLARRLLQEQDSEPLSWRVFNTPPGGNGTNPTIAADGSVSWAGLQNSVICTRTFPGDFTLQMETLSDNTRWPNTTMLQRVGTELKNTRPLFGIVRPAGTTNRDGAISDGDFAIGFTLAHPTKVFLERKGSELRVYRDTFGPLATPFKVVQNFTGELSLVSSMQASETATLFRPKLLL